MKFTPYTLDPRPGGRFRTVMRSPDGEELDDEGCFLEVVPNEKLVWMSALAPGYRPQAGRHREAQRPLPRPARASAVETGDTHPHGFSRADR